MNGGANPLARRVVAAPLAVEDAVNRLGRSLWLHLYLVNVANHTGRACRNVEKVAADLKVGKEKIEKWLSRLVDTKLVDVISPSPFLVLKLRSWPGSEDEKPASNGESTPVRIDVPVSISNAAAASKQSEDGGAGEGGTLLREAMAVTEVAERNELAPLIERHSSMVVREALRRVKATPPSQIRKSKLALFRYLLAKLS